MAIGIIFYFNLKNELAIIKIITNLVITISATYILKKLVSYKQNRTLIFLFYIFTIYSLISLGIFLAKIDVIRHNKPLIKFRISIENVNGQIKNIIRYEHEIKICFIVKYLHSENSIINKSIIKSSLVKICTYDQNAAQIKVGESVSFRKLTLNPLPLPSFKLDYQFARDSYFQNIIGTGHAMQINKNFQKYKPSIMDKINQERYKFSRYIVEEFGSEIGGIISAITVGDRSFLEEDLKNNMKKSSIFHLIATFIRRLSAIFFDRHIKYHVIDKIALFSSLIAISLYLTFSGVTLSAQRAVIMAFIVNISIFNGNQIINRKIISYTIITILIFQPHSILNPGLQMSICAVFSLVCFNVKRYTNLLKNYNNLEHINKLTNNKIEINLSKCSTWNNLCNKIKKIFGDLIKNLPRGTFWIFSIIAQTAIPHLAIMPITLFYFQNTSTYTLLTNLIAIPIATIIIGFTILYLIAKMFHVEHFIYISKLLLKTSIATLNKISSFCGKLPYNYIQTHQISLLSFALMIFGVIWIGVWQKSWRFYGTFFYFAGIMLCFLNTSPDAIIYEYRDKINTIIKIDNQLYGNKKQNNYIIRKILKFNNQDLLQITENVPRGTFSYKEYPKNKIIDLKNYNESSIKMFHVEHF